MMSLDEAIKHAEENYKSLKRATFVDILQYENCQECAEEHRQLAEWLKIVKRLEQIDIDKAVKEYCKSEKYTGKCDSVCSFCFGPQIFRDGYEQALIDLRNNENLLG